MDNVTICNLALSHLLVSRQIDDLEEGSQEAETCKLWFDHVRELVLKDHPWPFAERFAALALIEADPNPEWAYAYRAPNDCLAPRRIVSEGARGMAPSPAYRATSDDEGEVILSDELSPTLAYTADIDDPALFAPDFVQALSLRLAHHIAKPLAASMSLAQQAMLDYRGAVQRAQANAENEQQPDEPPEAAVIRAREG